MRVLTLGWLSLGLCFAQVSVSEGHSRFTMLIKRLEWERYWNNETSLGNSHFTGSKWKVFWSGGEGGEDVGLCLSNLVKCWYFPDVKRITGYREAVSKGDDNDWKTVAANLARTPGLVFEDGEFEFPELGTPTAFLKKKKRSGAETELLRRRVHCLGSKSRLNLTLVPYYDDNSQFVPVDLQCAVGAQKGRVGSFSRIILFPRLLDGDWILSVFDKEENPIRIVDLKGKIVRNLMIELHQ